MKRSNKIQVDVDCERMNLKKFPIAGYPLTVYKQNYEKVGFQETDNKIRGPPPPIHVKACSNPVGMYSIPRYRLNYVNKYMDVPVVQKVAKVVEIPEVRQITKYVDVVKVVDVPVEQIRVIPKLQVREVEKIRHVPGPIEYIDIPQEHIIHKPRKEIIEKIHEIPVIEDIEVEVPFYVPTPVGPPEEINIEIPLPYDVPQFGYRPEKTLLSPMPVALRRVENQDIIQPVRTDIEENEEDTSTIKVSQGSSRAMYSSPPLGSYVVNGKEGYPKKFKLRAGEDERLNSLLYNYNKQNAKISLPKKDSYNGYTGSKRKYSMNVLNCCNGGYKSPYKEKDNYIKSNASRYANRRGSYNVNTYTNDIYEMQEDISARSPVVKTDQYYYSYSPQNKNFMNYLNNDVNKDEYSFAQENPINDDVVQYNYDRNEFVENYRDVEYKDYNGKENFYNDQEQLDNNINTINNEENNSSNYYYGDESNYVYGNEYDDNSMNTNSGKKHAELIVKKSNRRY